MIFSLYDIKFKNKRIAKTILYLVFTAIVLIFFWGFTSPMYFHFLIAIGILIILDIFLYVFLRKIVFIEYKPLKKIIYTIIYFLPMALVLFACIAPYFVPYPDWNPVARSRFIGAVFVLGFTKGVFCLIYLFGIIHFVVRKNFTKDLGIPFKRLFRNYSRVAGLICVVSVFLFGFAFSYGERRIDVDTVNIEINNLPEEFDNYKIAHISDLHLGSINKKTVRKVVEIINSQNVDIICFTGDIVTYSSIEMEGFQNILRELKAKDGTYAVLGNHDYGTYSKFKNIDDQEEESKKIKSYISDSLHWNLLLNQSVEIRKDTFAAILIAGTENMSLTKRFISRGNLSATFAGKDTNMPTILLTHDPAIWKPFVIKDYPFVSLTLSGHTHGMQYGVPFRKDKARDAKGNQKEVRGLYKYDNQYLYITKGIGSSLLHGRLGMWADVSIITLVKGNK